MSLEVQPGSVVSVTVSKRPTNDRAAKTLSRIFGKDPANRRKRIIRKRLRTGSFSTAQRGGRPWVTKPKAPRLVQPTLGDACQIRATVDVVNDLQSVARFITIKPA